MSLEGFVKDLSSHIQIPRDLVVTPKNVNDSYVAWVRGARHTLLERAVLNPERGTLIPALLHLGAVITERVKRFCCPRNLVYLLDAGVDPDGTIEGGETFWEYHRRAHGLASGLPFDSYILLDYGGTIPYNWNAPRLAEYARCLDRRVANCRRALVVLVAYCRRSAYTGLRPVYAQLAKEMWHMRGSGERCGPRGENWNLEK